jgi:hypothetical protein
MFQIRSLLFIIILPFVSFSQVNDGLTPTERAYLFHIVKKSPILDHSIGRLIEYTGPLIKFKNNELNYDSLELLIINQPAYLIIRKDEIAKAPKGVLNEAANKMAIWELNKLLLSFTNTKIEEENIKDLEKFEELLIAYFPPNALKEKNNAPIIQPKLKQLLNPSLTLDEKVALVQSMHFLDFEDGFMVLTAINKAINQFVENRSYEIYKALGGQAEVYKNVLVAAGDGSSTSGVLDEREKDEKGRWNKGLPKAVGLFPYQLVKSTDASKKQKISSQLFATTDFTTVGENRSTNLHFDVWGYNSKKQTTVVIEKNGLNYHLFGSGETRFLSPDSTFSTGETFQKTIADLEKNKIGQLNEVIYGKKGFDYWIEYQTKKKNAVELKIKENEHTYSDLHSQPILTNEKRSKKSNPSKYKNGKGSTDYQPSTRSRKEKKKSQNEIVRLYNTYENYKRKIAQLEKDKQSALDLKENYQNILGVYKRNMGYKWAKFEEKDGLYRFEDSSTFDLYTQEFVFPPKKEKEGFEIRLISIPNHSLSKEADEVMLHVSLIDAKPHYSSKIQLQLNDVFESDKFNLNRPLLHSSDSLALLQIFEGLKNKKIPFKISVNGQGEGIWNGIQTIKNKEPLKLTSYPGLTAEERSKAKQDTSFVRLRTTEMFINLDRELNLEINSFTDPVNSNLNINNPVLIELMNENNWTKNEVLSAFRSYTIFNKLKEEINSYAGLYLKREDAKLVIDRFNRECLKTKIWIGATAIKQNDLHL